MRYNLHISAYRHTQHDHGCNCAPLPNLDDECETNCKMPVLWCFYFEILFDPWTRPSIRSCDWTSFIPHESQISIYHIKVWGIFVIFITWMPILVWWYHDIKMAHSIIIIHRLVCSRSHHVKQSGVIITRSNKTAYITNGTEADCNHDLNTQKTSHT